jgi:hypothetical protein
LLVDGISLAVVLSALSWFSGFCGAFVVPSLLDRWFLHDRSPGEAKPEVKRDPASERWCIIVATVGLVVLVAAVAAFMMSGAAIINSAE